MYVREVVDGPSRQKFGQRHDSQRGMLPSPLQVLRLQIQLLQSSQILLSQPGEIVQELLHRLFLILIQLGKAVKGIKRPRFAVLDNDPQPRHPVGALTENQVAHDVEHAPGIVSFVAVHQMVGSPRNRAFRVAGVRVRTAMVSAKWNSSTVAMST